MFSLLLKELIFYFYLNETNHVAAHLVIFCRSVLRHPATATGSFTIIYRLVSSANKRIFEPMSVTIYPLLLKDENSIFDVTGLSNIWYVYDQYPVGPDPDLSNLGGGGSNWAKDQRGRLGSRAKPWWWVQGRRKTMFCI